MDHEGLLLMQVKHGDKRAFEPFVERFWKPIWNLAYRFTGSRAESEDLCQDIFLKVYLNVNTFRGEGKTFTWLYRVAVNTCLNWKRKNKVMPLLTEREDQPSPHSTSYEAIMRLELQDAFSSLSKDDRLLLLLRKFQGLSYKEIGDVLSISEKTVKSRLHEAKTRLASKLEPLLETGGDQSWIASKSNRA